MTATLDVNKGILTIKTTQDSEPMPNFINASNTPWYTVRSVIVSIILEVGISTIGDFAFYGLDKLTSVTIPNSVTNIGISSFQDCSSLTYITIPNSVLTIGYYAFTDCIDLKSITIPDLILSISALTFQRCINLSSVTIGNSVKVIQNGAFEDCKSLTSVTIPNSVITIQNGAFRNCSNLTSVTIPNSVATIGDRTFSNCTQLKDITVNWIIPLSITNNVFQGVRAADVNLHVPLETENLYKAAPYWKDFKIVTYAVGNESVDYLTLKVYKSNGILHITGLYPGESFGIYNLNGQLLYKSVAKTEWEYIPFIGHGIYVVVAGERSIKIDLIN